MPRRHHVWFSACDRALEILDQPMNGNHAEDLLALANECLKTGVAGIEVKSRAVQGETMIAALAEVVKVPLVATQTVTQDNNVVARTSTQATPAVYVDTREGVYATGPAATQAARGFGGGGLNSFNGWVEAQSWANQVLSGGSVSTTGFGGMSPLNVVVEETTTVKPPNGDLAKAERALEEVNQ